MNKRFLLAAAVMLVVVAAMTSAFDESDALFGRITVLDQDLETEASLRNPQATNVMPGDNVTIIAIRTDRDSNGLLLVGLPETPNLTQRFDEDFKRTDGD